MLLNRGGKTLQLIGPVAVRGYSLAITMSNAAQQHLLIRYTWNFALISLTIAIMASILIYLIIYELMVRPMRSIYMNMLDFVIEPDNPSRIIVPEARRDKLGITQRRITAIEGVLQQNFVRQKHLADLGLAVAKINHDMRNVLASAQLLSDYLAKVKDPAVQRLAPKLIRTIDRAISITPRVLLPMAGRRSSRRKGGAYCCGVWLKMCRRHWRLPVRMKLKSAILYLRILKLMRTVNSCTGYHQSMP